MHLVEQILQIWCNFSLNKRRTYLCKFSILWTPDRLWKKIGLTAIVHVVKLDKEKVCVQIRTSQWAILPKSLCKKTLNSDQVAGEACP